MTTSNSEKTLVLVDGSSYLYRAFHAMPDLRVDRNDPQSAPTGAVRGMVNMMQSLGREVASDYAVCVFDAPGKTFRDDLYPAYKAQRSPMPDDLRAQIEPVHEVVKLLGWPLIMVAGVEADDVIATLAMWVGTLMYIPLGAMFWHAPALVFWNDVSPAKSLFFSMAACWKNKGAMVVYMGCWFVLFALASLVIVTIASALAGPQMIGALVAPLGMVLASMFFASIYATYRDSFVIEHIVDTTV